MDIKNVVAVVTGGASGLGEATVLELAKCDAKITVVDIDAERVRNSPPPAAQGMRFLPKRM